MVVFGKDMYKEDELEAQEFAYNAIVNEGFRIEPCGQIHSIECIYKDGWHWTWDPSKGLGSEWYTSFQGLIEDLIAFFENLNDSARH